MEKQQIQGGQRDFNQDMRIRKLSFNEDEIKK